MLAKSEKTKTKDLLGRVKITFLICHFCHKLLIEICRIY